MKTTDQRFTVKDMMIVGVMGALVFASTAFLKIGPIPTPAGPTMLKTGNILCLLAGLLFWRFPLGKKRRPGMLFLGSAFLSLPGTLASSAVTAFLFGGITSSGSTVLVQLLYGMGMDLTASVFLVQAATDYIDRTVVLLAAVLLYRALPAALKARLAAKTIRTKSQKGDRHGTL